VARRTSRADGFSLVETLVAVAILASGLTALAQLVTIAVGNNARSRSTSVASMLAADKIEQFRALVFGFDGLGLRLTDLSTDTAVVPEQARGGTGLSPSPAGSLLSDVAGYCDFADADGRPLSSTGGAAPPGAVYVRRWAIRPLPASPDDVLVIQVFVTARADRALTGTARMVTVRARKAP
jgi:prepilin-type N-terminal cleavage/methylation domain-containing protein